MQIIAFIQKIYKYSHFFRKYTNIRIYSENIQILEFTQKLYAIYSEKYTNICIYSENIQIYRYGRNNSGTEDRN